MLVTFTNRAAEEMKARLRHLIGRDAARAVMAGTFHSVALMLLRMHGHRIGLAPQFTILEGAMHRLVCG
jgi:DNA helicase II / ATP-dependent DNA helicase PcrA